MCKPYRMMNSILCTYRQLHNPRFCMQLFTQTTLIHQVRTNIAIIRSRVNQNRSKLIIKLIVHLNDKCPMFCMFVVHGCINMRKALPYIPNSLCLLCNVYLRPTTLILQTISPKVFLTLFLTLQLTNALTSMRLL